MENQRDRQITHLETIAEIAKGVGFSINLRDMLDYAMEKVIKALDIEACSLLLIDESTNELFFEISKGEKGMLIESKKGMLRLKMGQGIAGWVAQIGKACIINKPEEYPRFYKQMDMITGFATRNIVCVPLLVRSKIKGVIETVNRKKGDFNEVDLAFIYAVASQVAVAIENMDLYKEFNQSRNYYTGIIENMPGGLIGMDREGRIITANLTACRILGLVKKDMEGTHYKSALIRQREIADVLAKTLIEKTAVNRMELKARGKSDEEITIGYGTIITQNALKEITGVAIIFQDLTHIKEIKKRVEKILE